MSDFYILDANRNVIPCPTVTQWGAWMESFEKRRVASTECGTGVRVSTVFLGLDHNFGDGPPLVFETMVFGGTFDEECERCATWAEAEAQHRAMVEKVTARGPATDE
jgi:hypothetical protein